MENKSWFQKALPHIIVLVIFLVITFIYFSPLFEGKTLFQQDTIQSKAAAKEVTAFRDKTGRLPLWTNSMFGGMPAYLIGTDYPNSWSTLLGRFVTNLLPEPANLILLCLIAFYILLISINFNVWLAAIGAVAFTFGSYNFINIEAGHISKVIATAYLPPIIAGVILAYRGKYLLGAALTGLFLALQLYGNHVQITFYLFISLSLYGIFELVYAFREKRLKQFGLATLALAVAVALSVGSHASRLLTTYEYSKESIRGKSELTQNTQNKGSGLDKEYAFRWSYGKLETFTLLIPSFYGGASQGSLSTSSDTYKTLLTNGVPQAQARQFIEQAPLYWGEQPGTGGPAYAGAIVCFLFVLGLFIVKGRMKWWLLAVTLLFIFLAWGKSLPWFNYFVFDYVPFFNKFRAVTMILTIVQAYIALLAMMAVREIVQTSITWKELKKPFLYSLGLTAGLAALLGLFAGGFFDFVAGVDTQLPGWLLEPIRDDRKSMLQRDAFRSVFFILAAAALLWAYVQNKLKSTVVYTGLFLLILIDMFGVNKRFLNNDDFISKRRAPAALQATEADMQILQDKDPNFRVLNTTVSSPFEDATTSYYHKSLGGYHAAKMLRFQELLERQISKNNMAVLNMLNTKYFIIPGQNGQPVAQRNPDALGNAWFVEEYKLVPNADEEIEAISDFNPARTAIIDRRFASLLNGLQTNPDTAATITLTSYQPDYLTYQAKTSSPQVAVFSEIYYQGKGDWQAYIDGKPQPHFRVNYILRGMVVPAGTHKIEFRFNPPTYKSGETIALICSILLFSGVGVALFLDTRRKKVKDKQAV